MRIRLPYPHAGQKVVMREAKRFNHLCAGRRWRKTTLCLSILTIDALNSVGLYIWGSPSHQQSMIAFSEAEYAYQRVVTYKRTPPFAVKFPNGSEIMFISLDNPNNVRGFSPRKVVIDETQIIKRESWHDALRPSLISSGGGAWLIGTSNGKNWWWEERQNALTRDDTAVWSAPTLGCKIVDERDDRGRIISSRLARESHYLENHDIPFSEIQSLFEDLPRDVFEREILSDDNAMASGRVYDTWTDRFYPIDGYNEDDNYWEWATGGGGDNPPIQGNVTPQADYLEGGGHIIWSIDDGYTGSIDKVTGLYTATSHPRVIGFYQIRKNGQVCRFDEVHGLGTLVEDHIDEALEKPYPRPLWVSCESSPEIKIQLANRGTATKGKPANFDASMKIFRSSLKADKNGFVKFLVHPRCKLMRQEMVNYSYDTKGKPNKEFDHSLDEGRYLTWQLRYA